MHETVLARWVKQHLAAQCPKLQLSLELWQGYQLALRSVQLNSSSIVDVDDLRGAIEVIEQSFTALPIGSVLWHATHDTCWTHDPRLWLATSTSAQKAIESVSYKTASPPLLMKLVVMSENVRALPCSADPWYDEEEVVLSREVQLSRDLQSDGPRIVAYWIR